MKITTFVGTKKRKGKVIGHYVIINKNQPVSNLNGLEGNVNSISGDRVFIVLDGKEYSLPKKVVKIR